MKKVLLTTSALTLLAGAAAAQISLNGSGRIGVTSTGGTTAVTHRFRVNVNASGETDGGMTFGAYVRINMNGGAVGAIGAPRLWIGNGTATLTVGNAGGATVTNGNIFGCGVGFTGSCADLPNPNFTWVTHASGAAGASVVRLDFALGSANVSISGGSASGGAANNNELAASFSIGNAKVGISYDDGGTAATGGTQVHVTFDAGSANVALRMAQATGGATGYMASANFAIGAGSLYVFGGNQLNGAGTATQTSYGVSYAMGLGGGASALVSVRSVAGTVTTDAGVKFKF